jgi:hypothetical protein
VDSRLAHQRHRWGLRRLPPRFPRLSASARILGTAPRFADGRVWRSRRNACLLLRTQIRKFILRHYQRAGELGGPGGPSFLRSFRHQCGSFALSGTRHLPRRFAYRSKGGRNPGRPTGARAEKAVPSPSPPLGSSCVPRTAQFPKPPWVLACNVRLPDWGLLMASVSEMARFSVARMRNAPKELAFWGRCAPRHDRTQCGVGP